MASGVVARPGNSQFVGLDCLTRDLIPVASKWKELGIELEVPMAELNAIGALFTGEEGKAQVCLRRVVLEWLNNSTKPVTRKVLEEALETLGEKRRADELPEDLLSAEELECKPKPLLKELRPIAAKYHGLGIYLGISPAKIREFEAEAGGQDVQRFLREVLDRWLGGDPQLGVLVDGLIEIGNRRLAERVEVDYQGKQLVLVVPKTTAPQVAMENRKPADNDDSGCDSDG